MDTLKEKNHLEALWASNQAPWKIWNHAGAGKESQKMEGSKLMKVLVTGTEGYIGSLLGPALIQARI